MVVYMIGGDGREARVMEGGSEMDLRDAGKNAGVTAVTFEGARAV